jgi:dipeptidyl aminopeptidase/acylaminoacyl peptidase
MESIGSSPSDSDGATNTDDSSVGPRGRRWLRPTVVALLLVALVAVGGYAGIGYLAYQELSSVDPGCGTREFKSQTPADFAAYDGDHSLSVDTSAYRFTDYQTVAFPSRDPALTIRGWYATGPAGKAAPTVIVVHGHNSCRRDPVVMLPAAMLHRAGFGVLLIDLRNHGDSDADNGRWAGGSKEYRDVLGAWDWLVQAGHDPARIGLLGMSLGAATVTIATGEEERVAAAWADSSPADIGLASAEYASFKGYPEWVAGAAIPIGRLIGDAELVTRSPDDEVLRLLGRPFAIVHGLADKTAQPHHAVDLAAAAFAGGTSVEPWIIPGAEHVEGVLLRPSDYEARLVAFFSASLGSPMNPAWVKP